MAKFQHSRLLIQVNRRDLTNKHVNLGNMSKYEHSAGEIPTERERGIQRQKQRERDRKRGGVVYRDRSRERDRKRGGRVVYRDRNREREIQKERGRDI